MRGTVRQKGGYRKMLAALAALGVASATAAVAQARLSLPSGLRAELQEAIDEAGAVLRFRYVAPDFDAAAPLRAVAADLAHLCNADAARRAAEMGRRQARIVISLANRRSQFGVPDPDVRQVFEAFTLENGTCIWEAF